MTTEKMTMHKALCEKKIMGSRIANTINQAVFVKANKHSNQKIDGVTIADYKAQMTAGNQTARDLIKREIALNKAIVLSNAETKVMVAGEEYTVAEAIWMKNHGLDSYKVMLRKMKNDFSRATEQTNANSGDPLERRAEVYVNSVIAAQPKDSKMAIDSDAMKSLKDTYIKDNTYDLIDPLQIGKAITELENWIYAFESDVDSALSTSNALTTIEFSY